MTSPVYLDHNASTPMDPVVIDVMTEAMHTHFANPSSGEHAAGAAASQAVEHARGIYRQGDRRPPDGDNLLQRVDGSEQSGAHGRISLL